ncbi:hypothetical protein GP2143_03478 [marine gamma proteobacterium HTCC2143]|uniref:Uncharacterized protein n=1 Tax=marine gamma proteobacterium HTCC2143 TaxID=247633 RepID=A0YD47_9GAMM|nr:hypothetical protein GP2143_03478 [marine gamma proteobacterium HTCC2143]
MFLRHALAINNLAAAENLCEYGLIEMALLDVSGLVIIQR